MALAEQLSRLPGVLSGFGPEELTCLAAVMTEVALAPDERVSQREGEPRVIAFLLEGSLEVMKETDFEGKHVVLALMEPGAVVGEVCAFSGNCQALCAVSVGASRLAVLSLEALDRLTEQSPGLSAKLYKGLLEVAARRLDSSYARLVSVF